MEAQRHRRNQDQQGGEEIEHTTSHLTELAGQSQESLQVSDERIAAVRDELVAQTLSQNSSEFICDYRQQGGQ